MSADLLKRAAAKLRDALAADYLTDAPWLCLDGGDRIVHIEPPTGAVEYVVDEPMSNPSNAEYIALMHPPVALALAAWIEAHAKDIGQSGDLRYVDSPGDTQHAISVAHAILREVDGD